MGGTSSETGCAGKAVGFPNSQCPAFVPAARPAPGAGQLALALLEIAGQALYLPVAIADGLLAAAAAELLGQASLPARYRRWRRASASSSARLAAGESARRGGSAGERERLGAWFCHCIAIAAYVIERRPHAFPSYSPELAATQSRFRQVRRSLCMNTIRTAMLLAFMTALFMAVGYLIGGSGGMMIAFLIAAGDEPLQLLERRQDGAEDAPRASRSTSATRPSISRIVARSRGAGRPADAEGLSDRQRRSPTPLPPGATRRTPPSPRPPGLLHRLSHEEVAGGDGA